MINAKLILMTVGGIIIAALGIAIAAAAALLLDSWLSLLIGAYFVGSGTWMAVSSTINRRGLASK